MHVRSPRSNIRAARRRPHLCRRLPPPRVGGRPLVAVSFSGSPPPFLSYASKTFSSLAPVIPGISANAGSDAISRAAFVEPVVIIVRWALFRSFSLWTSSLFEFSDILFNEVDQNLSRLLVIVRADEISVQIGDAIDIRT